MGRLKNWIEERFEVSTFTKAGNDYLNKPVPDHVNYAFTLGTAALVLFMTQVGSGILLAMNYTPSLEEAHASVGNITYDIPSGWFIRSTQCETPVRPGTSSPDPTRYQHHTDASGAVCTS